MALLLGLLGSHRGASSGRGGREEPLLPRDSSLVLGVSLLLDPRGSGRRGPPSWSTRLSRGNFFLACCLRLVWALFLVCLALLLGVEGGGASSVASAWDCSLVETFSSLRVDGEVAAAA